VYDSERGAKNAVNEIDKLNNLVLKLI